MAENFLNLARWQLKKLDYSKVKVKDAQLCLTLQPVLSMEFSRPESWSGQAFPFSGDLPNPWIEPRSPALQANSLPTELSGNPDSSQQESKYIHVKAHHT